LFSSFDLWAHLLFFPRGPSLLVVIVILATTIGFLRQCINILLQSVPNEVDLGELRQDLLKIDGIFNVHDLHVWQARYTLRYYFSIHSNEALMNEI